MVRTQIQLTEEQARRLRRQAHEDRVSVAEAIRRYIDQGLQAEQVKHDDLAAKYDRARRSAGTAHALQGETDLSINHDRYLEEDFG
ncbi:MAG: ribbon-helix-helix protein, CopG family [Terriglobales bacterium]